MTFPSCIGVFELTTKKGTHIRRIFHTLMDIRDYKQALENESTYEQKVNKIVKWEYKLYYPR